MGRPLRVEELIEALKKADPKAFVYASLDEKANNITGVIKVETGFEVTQDGTEESGVILWTQE